MGAPGRPNVTEVAALKYRAFLSYSHRDVGWARWLHTRLEGFRIDRDLVGRDTALGPVPKTLRPIFRDREDFSGGHSLTEATVVALDASAALIVLCSSAAASRPAVNEEVRLFRSRHPERPVIPVIIDGTAPDNFPPALRFDLDADSKVSARPITILGPDLRESADGKDLGLAKIVAGLTGLGPDDIFRRAERTRRRRTQIWGGVAGLCLLLAVLASGSAVYAWQQLKTNEAFLSATLKTATDIVNTAVAHAEKYNVPRAATLELLSRAEGLFDNMARFGRPTLELQYQKARMLIQFARNYAALGDSGKERSRAEEAYHLMAGLAAARPYDADYQVELAAAYDEIGDVQMAQGDLGAALKSYRDSLAIRKRLAQSDPNNAGGQRDLSISHNKVGKVQIGQGDLSAALKSFRDGLTIRQRLAQSDPGNAGWQRDLSVSYDDVGDAQVAQGDLAAALKSYRDSLAIDERLAKSDPGNAGWQRDLSASYDRVGDVQMEQGHLTDALKSYRDSLAIRQRLTQSDPGNARWQNDLSLSDNKIGRLQMEQGDLAAALKSYRDGLAIRQRLAQSDPGNAGWQRDLAVSHKVIGDAQVAQGDLAAALKSYRDSLAIDERLAKSDPGNTGWQRDLLASYDSIGDVQVAQGDLAGALKSYREALAVAERLVRSDPGNAGWQRDLAVSHHKLGDEQLARGDLASALTSYQTDLAIMERLAKSDPGNAGWQRDVALSYASFAKAYRRYQDYDRALEALRQGQAIMIRLVKLSPENATWMRTLDWFNDEVTAVTVRQWKCTGNSDVAWDEQIVGCTNAIQSGKYGATVLARFYNNRGIVYKAKSDVDGAIGDYDQAIMLDPKYAYAYNNRGLAYLAKGDYDRAIADYDRAIALDPKYAIAYNNRGFAYNAKGDYERAIADYDQAIAINPLPKGSAGAINIYNNRGLAYQAKGDYDRAIADYNEAIRLDPKFASAYYARGRVYLYTDVLPNAVADLKQATELNPVFVAYTALWLDIANKRSNLPSRLAEATSRIEMTKWPAPVIRLYLGQITPEAVLAAADNPNSDTKKDQVCEANFYTAEMFLQQGKREDATRLLQLAAADCPKKFTEYEGAIAELKALGVNPE